MKKEKILEQIDELKQKIEMLEKKVTSPEFEGIKKGVRWKPEYEEKYFFVDSCGDIDYRFWEESEADLFRFNTGNCFKTEQEALDYRENILTKQALKDLALELNEGVEIDWKDENQRKYFFNYDNKRDCFLDNLTITLQASNIYCLNIVFLDIAIDRIGKEKIIKLIKSGV